MIKIGIIAGARPNFMKIAPVIHEIKKINSSQKKIDFRLVHTGQHYDKNMSDSFFEDLKIPYPDINFNVGSGSQSEQTAKIMILYEKLLIKETSDFCLVVGDVTSTMACSIVAKKMGLMLGHVEGGIRSDDLTMPEEINRILVDHLSTYRFVTETSAFTNLKKEGLHSTLLYPQHHPRRRTAP